MLKLHHDFKLRATVHSDDVDWASSPARGVERKMLERIGDERARATSVVRYSPGARFDEHAHPYGEEILVLEGTYGDDQGSYPAGTYTRAPWGSKHAPCCVEGAVILTKARQLPAGETPLVVDTRAGSFEGTDTPGVRRQLLFDGREEVCLERWAPGTVAPREIAVGGKEIFVMEGAFADEDGEYRRWSWLRIPVGEGHTGRSRSSCLLYVKRGHLVGL